MSKEKAIANNEDVVDDVSGRFVAGIAYLVAAIVLLLCIVLDPHNNDVWLSGGGAIALSWAALYQFRKLTP